MERNIKNGEWYMDKKYMTEEALEKAVDSYGGLTDSWNYRMMR